MGLPGMVLSAIAAVAGAIMYWAITYQGTGFRLSTVGLIRFRGFSDCLRGVEKSGAFHQTLD